MQSKFSSGYRYRTDTKPLFVRRLLALLMLVSGAVLKSACQQLTPPPSTTSDDAVQRTNDTSTSQAAFVAEQTALASASADVVAALQPSAQQTALDDLARAIDACGDQPDLIAFIEDGGGWDRILADSAAILGAVVACRTDREGGLPSIRDDETKEAMWCDPRCCICVATPQNV